MNFFVLLILLLTGLTCLIPGIFLTIKNQSMLVDALSHSILFGIVVGFMISANLNSPWVLLMATVTGILTSILINLLSRTRKFDIDVATIATFSFFFSLAIIFINLGFKNVHLDLDSVLLGEVIYTPLDTYRIGNLQIPKSLVSILICLPLCIVVFLVFLRGFKVGAFDTTFAQLSGFKPKLLSFVLMAMSSLVACISFSSLGTILVISLMIGPVVIAKIITTNFTELVISSIIVMVCSTILGYVGALYFDVSVAGMIGLIVSILLGLAIVYKSAYIHYHK